MHALIIEDGALIAMAIEDVLSGCGFTSFDVAVSFDEAVASARARCPRLITADVELRPGSGLDAVNYICSNSPIPATFIAGRADLARKRMPHHPVLHKPFSVKDVHAAVHRVMRLEPDFHGCRI